MPLDVGTFATRAPYKSEQQCQKSSFAFYRAVRDLLPVWLLEDMRTMEVFHWEDDDGRACAFSPSEALLYALVHDHQPYARYLLERFSVRALEMPSRSFRCCPEAATPHLTVAVRYNRTAILKMIVDVAEQLGVEEKRLFLNSRGCAHASGGKTALHLACDLVRPECLILLLGHGACPYVTDGACDAPLDCLLAQISQSELDTRLKHVCLGYLLLFMPAPRFRMRRELQENAALWTRLVGQEAFKWLSGQTPSSLFVQSMQKLARSVPAEQMDALPDFLRPLDFRLNRA